MSEVRIVDGESYAAGKPFVPEVMSLPEMLDRTAERVSNSIALTFYQQQFTYREMKALTQQLAAALHAIGVQPNDRVGLMLPNCPQYVAAFYGVMRRGATVVQVNPLYMPREIEYVMDDSQTDVLFVLDDLYPRVKQIASFDRLKRVIVVSLSSKPVDLAENSVLWRDFVDSASAHVPDARIDPLETVAVLQYTGGTTGRSKGAMLTHANLVANVQQINEHASEDPFTADDKILAVIPLFHVYGMTCAMNLGVLTGTNVILLPRFDPLEVLNTIKTHRPSYFPGVPTMYVALNTYPNASEYGIDAIRICNSGSAPLPVEFIHSFEQKTGAKMYEGYGLSEASPTTHSTPRRMGRKPGSIGIPLPGTEARIVDMATGTRICSIGEAGELTICGPQVMKGYWQMAEETAHAIRDGWLYTGDIARMDEDGYFTIIDRKKDMIIAGGFNIYPREIEEVLYTHPAVLEAVVFGVPDDYRGETVKAVIVTKPDTTVTQEEIENYCRQHLAAFKIPRLVEFADSLPKTAVGKILRRTLVEEAKKKATAGGENK